MTTRKEQYMREIIAKLNSLEKSNPVEFYRVIGIMQGMLITEGLNG